MQKTEKFIRKLNERDKLKVAKTIQNILINNLQNLDIKKMKGVENLYRVRIGRIRICFLQIDGGENKITFIGFRDENTY